MTESIYAVPSLHADHAPRTRPDLSNWRQSHKFAGPRVTVANCEQKRTLPALFNARFLFSLKKPFRAFQLRQWVEWASVQLDAVVFAS